MQISTLAGRWGWLVGLLIASVLPLNSAVAQSASKVAVASPPPSRAVQFIANRNQWDKSVLFAADVPGGRLFLEKGRLTQALYDTKAVTEHHETAASHPEQRIKAHAYSVTFEGANLNAAVRGAAETGDKTNYILGNDPQRWAHDVPSYAEVRYQELYAGTNLRFYTHDNQLEYDLELATGADPSRIRLRYDGQQQLRVIEGALHITTSVGKVVEQRPYAYQQIDGKPVRVPCEYALDPHSKTVSFRLPKGYDSALPLVIDPVLVYSSYSGSLVANWGYSSTYDSLGNLYCGSVAFGLGYPTTVGAYSVSFAGTRDIAIMKFNPKASGAASRLYATYLGGGNEEHPHSLLVDHAGNLIIYGSTLSSDFPTTAGAYSRSIKGGADIILSKLNPTGTALVASTYLGGSAIDGQLPEFNYTGTMSKNFGDSYRGDVAVDRQNNIYLASTTQSSDFPVAGGFQTTLQGARDAIVTKLPSSLGAVEWSTFLGGSEEDAAYSIQLDNQNNVFVSGGTMSTDFPGTANGYLSSFQGGTTDGFVARITPNGRTLTQATYLGTSGYDQAYFVQLDQEGEVYLYGQTDGNYPVTPGLYVNPNSRQFIHKLNPQLTVSRYSTVIGNGPVGPTNISPTAFLVDECGEILLSGYGSNILNMPITSDAIQSQPIFSGSNSVNGDFYLMQLSAGAQQLLYGSYFGNGTLHVDGGASRFDKRGIIYQTVCAGTGYPLVPITANAWSPVFGNLASGRNAVAFKIDVLQLPELSAGADRTICPGGSVTLTVAPATVGTFTWSPAEGLNTTSGATVVASPKVPTRYTVRGTFANGCSSETTVQVLIYTPPTLAFSSLPLEYTNRQVSFLNTSQGATSYNWDFGDGQSSTETAPTHSYAQAGTYSVKLTALYGNGCQQELVQSITIRDIFVANIITPNEDQKNDHFEPRVSTQPVALKIFNRWGKLVFESADYSGGWGDPSTPAGIYYYQIMAKTGESWKGWLQVNR